MFDFSKGIDLSKVGAQTDSVSKDIKDMVRNTGVDMTPSEENSIYQAIVDERYSQETQRVFHSIDDGRDLENAVKDFSRRLVSRIFSTGFVALVSTDLYDTDNFDMFGNDDHWSIIWHPRVDIVKRVDGKNESELDEEQIAYEVRHGQADGKTGHFDSQGNWTDDPDSSKMIV